MLHDKPAPDHVPLRSTPQAPINATDGRIGHSDGTRLTAGDTKPAATAGETSAWIMSALLALVPLSLAVSQQIKALVPGVLFIVGTVVLARRSDIRACMRATWPVFASVLAAIAIAIINVLVHRLGWRSLGQTGHLLLFAVIAATFGLRLRPRLIWVGLALTDAALGAVCVWQYHVLGLPRAFGLNGGHSSAIQMGTLLLALALVALTQALRENRRLSQRLFYGVCAALGAYGALLTESRGPMLAFLPAFAVIILTYARRSRHWRRAALLIGVSVLGVALLGLTVRGVLVHRFDAGNREITSMLHGDLHRGSIGNRIEMWKIALRAFREHPIEGIGLDQYQSFVRSEIAAGRAWPVIIQYNQPHNAYLAAAACGGVLSLGTLLLLILMPLRYFVRHLRDADGDVVAATVTGAAVVVLYAIGCLTEDLFFRVMSLSLYLFVTLGFVTLIETRLRSRAATEAVR